MFKTLLASTALTALVTTSAMAASHSENKEMQNEASMQTEATMEADATAMGENTLYSRSSLASDLIGSAIYASSAEDADMIGDVNNIVIAPNGEVASVVVGVGGFLGIGEKDVEIEFRTIEWVDRDGDRWLVANMSREQLESAPAFNYEEVYTEARSEAETGNLNEAGDQTAAVDANNMDAADQNTDAADQTAERIEQGESAVEAAENQTTGMDRESMTRVSADQLSAENLMGQPVYSAENENIGEISDVLLTSDNQVEAFIIDVGGFLGMGEKPVAISPENLDIRSDNDGELVVFTPLTETEFESHQEYSEEEYEANRDSIIMVVPAG
ncbi:PRC-barrel domain-containing protein [Hoeflea sp.]|uniref:PRC-barrel domain-containing protein n=1 Tax=Hoeflea sp. TaxID=1940281 RepID=UPI003BB12055